MSASTNSGELRRSIGLGRATAMVVGIIIGASIFVQPSAITASVPSIPGVLTRLGGRRCAHAHRIPGRRRAGIGVAANRWRVRVPARSVVTRHRLPVGMGDVLDDAHRNHRRHRDGVRAIPRHVHSDGRHGDANRGNGEHRLALGRELSRRGPGRRGAGVADHREGAGDRGDRGYRRHCRCRRAHSGNGRRGADGDRARRVLRRTGCRTVRLRRLAHGVVRGGGDRRPGAHHSARAAVRHTAGHRAVRGGECRLPARASAGHRGRVERRGRRLRRCAPSAARDAS